MKPLVYSSLLNLLYVLFFVSMNSSLSGLGCFFLLLPHTHFPAFHNLAPCPSRLISAPYSMPARTHAHTHRVNNTSPSPPKSHLGFCTIHLQRTCVMSCLLYLKVLAEMRSQWGGGGLMSPRWPRSGLGMGTRTVSNWNS